MRWLPAALAALGGLLFPAASGAQEPAVPVWPVVPPLPVRLPAPGADTAAVTSPVERPANSQQQPSPPSPSSREASTDAEVEALRRSRVHEFWYGWQTLTIDAAAVGVLILGATSDRTALPFAEAAAGAYAIGPPIVHFAHGNVGKGLGSLALRLLGPLVGYELASWLSGPRDQVGLGIVAGPATAVAADAGLLAWDRWSSPGSATGRARFGVSWAF
jgi:hypothetical protein